MAKLSGARSHPVDTPAAIMAAAFLMSLNQLIVNVQPLVLGALAETYTLSDGELGHVSAIFVGSTAIATATGPLWVRRVNWRWSALVLVIASSLAYAGGAFAQSVAAILAFFAVIGVLKGGLSAVSFASLGDASNPDRSFAVGTIMQAVLAAIVTYPLSSWIIPTYGAFGMFMTLALIVATGLLAGMWVPTSGPSVFATNATGEPRDTAKILSAAAVPPLLALFALTLFIGGILGYWYFAERIGNARGSSPDFIGIVLSATALSSLATSAIVAWLGGRVSSFVFIWSGTGMLVGGYAMLAVPGDPAYFAATFLFGMGWGIAQPAYWAILRKVDATGKLFVAASAASGIAGVFIGLVAGPIIEAGGYTGIVVFAAALCILGMIILAFAARLGKSRAPS